MDDLGQVHFSDTAACQPENVVLLRSVPSTNRLARHIAAEYLKEGETVPGALVLALEQTAGRGRHGRAWSSPAGLGLYATLVLPLDDLAELPRLPLLAGVGLARALNPHLGDACRLKWPNDLMVDGKKLGGILIETETRRELAPVALIGFGINYGHAPEQLPIAASTSIAIECEQPPTLGTLAGELVGSLYSALRWRRDNQETLRLYDEVSLHRPGDIVRCRLDGGAPLEGVFLGFDQRGYLRMRSGEREVLLNSGDLELPGGDS